MEKLFTVKLQNGTSIQLSRMDMANISSEYDFICRKEDVENELEENNYNVDVINEELLEEMTEVMQEYISDLESNDNSDWRFAVTNTLEDFKDKLKPYKN